MASYTALNYLALSATNKDELEVFFDFDTILSQTAAGDSEDPTADLFRQLLPDVDDIASILRDEGQVYVNSDNQIEVSIEDLFGD